MALTTTQLTNDTDRLIGLRELVQVDKRQLDILELVVNDLVTEIQTQAVAADAVSQAYLGANRRFIKNTDAVSRVLEINGTNFTFVSGGIYCVDKGELEFFLQQAERREFGFAESTLALWLITPNVQFFYW